MSRQARPGGNRERFAAHGKGNAISLHKRIASCLGWMKTIGGIRGQKIANER